VANRETPEDIWHSLRSWQEDFDGENGQYLRVCLQCQRSFYGNRDRVVCRECVFGETAPKSPIPV